jgi:DNA-binding transcriptional MerR regulator
MSEMPRPKVSNDMTTSNVARELGMSTGQLIRWVNVNALPAPSHIDDNGVRYFNQEWLDKAKEILQRKRGNG